MEIDDNMNWFCYVCPYCGLLLVCYICEQNTEKSSCDSTIPLLDINFALYIYE